MWTQANARTESRYPPSSLQPPLPCKYVWAYMTAGADSRAHTGLAAVLATTFLIGSHCHNSECVPCFPLLTTPHAPRESHATIRAGNESLHSHSYYPTQAPHVGRHVPLSWLEVSTTLLELRVGATKWLQRRCLRPFTVAGPARAIDSCQAYLRSA